MGDNGIVVLCPTRGRPYRARQMLATFYETIDFLWTQIVLVVDEDDPELAEYMALPAKFIEPAGSHPLRPPDRAFIMVLRKDQTGNLTKATNSAAVRLWGDDIVIGHVGDDHAFRTPGWDRRILEALREPGVAYGNDLNVRELVPTACFISSVIPRTLGWYALPTTNHLYIDTCWKELGQRLGRLTYFDDVVIEHMHPSVQKAKMDDGYRLNNGPEMWNHDRAAFEQWLAEGADADVAKLREALGIDRSAAA